MQEPFWIPENSIHAIHDEQLTEHGGASGIRDQGLLESALARPQQAYFYGQADIIGLAALYAHGLCKNHPFIDGNKRTAFLAAYTFLGMNGYQLTASEVDATTAMLQLAASEMDEIEFAAWLRNNTAQR